MTVGAASVMAGALLLSGLLMVSNFYITHRSKLQLEIGFRLSVLFW